MKRKFNALFLFVLVISGAFAVSCDKNEEDERPVFKLHAPSGLDSIDYEVYSALINRPGSTVVIEQQVLGNSGIQYYGEDFLELYPAFDTTLLKNCLALENQTAYLGPYFKTNNCEVVLLSDDELNYYFNNPDYLNGWNNFYKDYEHADGIISFTRIAFNDAKTQAVFETGFGYELLGGDGSIVLMVKENGKWVVKASIATWIA